MDHLRKNRGSRTGEIALAGLTELVCGVEND
jgi:hypothetical protein